MPSASPWIGQFALCLALAWLVPSQGRELADANVDSSLQAPSPKGVTIGVGNATWSGTPRIVSWHPMAVVYDKFLTDEECDYLLKLSKPEMEPAMLVNSNEMKHIRSKSRTSHGAFFDSFGDEVLSMITYRIAHVAKVPPENLEPWQFMQYGPSEKYTRHVDYYDRDERFFGNDVEKFGGQRIKTALVYLTDAEGGETVFPKSMVNNTVGLNSCAGKKERYFPRWAVEAHFKHPLGLFFDIVNTGKIFSPFLMSQLRPMRGAGVACSRGALLVFDDVRPDGSLDGSSSHQSCPVKKGEKVVVSRFIRQEACNLNKFFSKRKWNGNVFCEDDHNKCKEWAAQGHCTSSDTYYRERMIGDENWTGFCEKTCGVCRPLEDTVIEMRRQTGRDVPPEAITGYFASDFGADMEEIYARR